MGDFRAEDRVNSRRDRAGVDWVHASILPEHRSSPWRKSVEISGHGPTGDDDFT
jgi:hypothetical protein